MIYESAYVLRPDATEDAIKKVSEFVAENVKLAVDCVSQTLLFRYSIVILEPSIVNDLVLLLPIAYTPLQYTFFPFVLKLPKVKFIRPLLLPLDAVPVTRKESDKVHPPPEPSKLISFRMSLPAVVIVFPVVLLRKFNDPETLKFISAISFNEPKMLIEEDAVACSNSGLFVAPVQSMSLK